MNFKHRESVKPKLLDVPVNQVELRHDRPRRNIDQDVIDRMMLSLSTVGQLQPISVRRHGNRWSLIFVYLRFHAAKQLGWKTIQAMEYGETESAVLVDLAIWAGENQHRSEPELNEMAVTVSRMAGAGMSDSAIALALGKSIDWVACMLNISGDPSARHLIETGMLVDVDGWQAFNQLALSDRMILVDGSEPITRQSCDRTQAESVRIKQVEQKKKKPVLQKPFHVSQRCDSTPDLFVTTGSCNENTKNTNRNGSSFDLFGETGAD